ncbi:MAG: FHA domain-containing protein [Armatimonas sp.]
MDYYELLGVTPSASEAVIRAAFRALVQDAMDDQPRFAALTEAFEVLKDPERRAAYDAERAAAPPAAEATAMGNATVQMSATQMGNAAPTAAAASAPVGFLPGAPCPVCKTVAPPDDGFCQECGLMLGATIGAQPKGGLLPKLIDTTGREFPLKKGANIVGREGSDVMLPDKTVSRRHATITVAEGNVVTIEDHGSTNGTKAAGNPMIAGQSVGLIDGASVRFGSVDLTIHIPLVPGAARLSIGAKPVDKTRMPVAALASGASQPAARLVTNEGKEYTLKSTSTVFGRKPASDVVLTGDAFISGTHAKVVYENGSYKVIDLGSTNGTKVNGQKLTPNVPVALADGDAVQLGQTNFLFRAPK